MKVTHEDQIRGVTLSGDGKTLLCAGLYVPKMYVWDVDTESGKSDMGIHYESILFVTRVDCFNFSSASPYFVYSSVGKIKVARYDDLIGGLRKGEPTHFVPHWYLLQLIEHRQYDSLQRVLENNPASILMNHGLFNNIVGMYDEYLLEFIYKAIKQTQPVFQMAPILKTILNSDNAFKGDILKVILEHTTQFIERKYFLFHQEDIANIFAEALKSSIFVGSIENFFRTTPLLESPFAQKKANNKLVPFKDDGTLIVSGSSNSFGLWERVFSKELLRTKNGKEEVPVGAVVPLANVSRSHLLNELVETNRSEFFDTIIVRSIINFKWQAFGRKMFLRQFGVYMGGLLTLVLMSILFSGQSELTIVDRFQLLEARNIATLVFAFGVLLWIPLALRHEIVQYTTERCEGGARWSSWKTMGENIRNSLSDMWNTLDLIHISLSVALLVTFCIGLQVTELLLSIAVYIRWIGILYYLQAFDSTGPLTQMILQILLDMRPMLLVLFISVVASANSFYVLLQHEDNGGEYNNVAISLFTSFSSFILSSFNTKDFAVGPFAIFLQMLFVITAVFVPVVLLNLLIALMNDSYEMVQDRSLMELNRLKAKIISEQELFLSPSDFQKPEWFPTFIHVLLPQGTNVAVGGDNGYRGMMNEIKAKVDTRFSQLKERVEELNVEMEEKNKQTMKTNEEFCKEIAGRLARIEKLLSKGELK
jgi:hypothetical protein